jgi:hypothetical protein
VYVVVGARLQTKQFFRLLYSFGQQNDRDVGFLSQPSQQLNPIHLGHDDIEDYKVWRSGLDLMQRRLRVAVANDIVPFAVQHVLYESDDLGVVIDDRYTRHSQPL